MSNLLKKKDKILLAGASGLAGNAIFKSLVKAGYGDPNNSGQIFTPKRKELNYLYHQKVEDWMEINRPDIVIIAAGVGEFMQT